MSTPVKSKAPRGRKPSRPHAWPIGCGVDVVELERFRQAVKRWGEAFLERIFTEDERKYAHGHQDAVRRLAVRFAAKEAVVKAMAQVDPSRPLTLRQIEIQNDELGRPYVVLRHQPKDHPAVYVSLSHAEHLAIASAIVSRR